MRNKIKGLLIILANWIGTKDYYDFGEQVIALQQFKGKLFVATKHTLYQMNEKKKTWSKVKVEKKKP